MIHNLGTQSGAVYPHFQNGITVAFVMPFSIFRDCYLSGTSSRMEYRKVGTY